LVKKVSARQVKRNVEPSGEDAPVDHRTIVARRRRANTETKIIRAAVQVFADRGVDAPVIDDFIKAAGIARGTFYNYFRSVEELLRATFEWLSEELIEVMDVHVRQLKDPEMRFGVGIRLWMRWALDNPLWCLFIARIWNSVRYERPLNDLREGIRKKVFSAPDAYVAWDVVSGAVRQAMFRIGEGGAHGNYGDGVVRMCLLALGVKSERVVEIMNFALPERPRR
jgi:AcrR family transcriptional regulator